MAIKSFIEVTVCSNSAGPDEAQRKKTIATKHILKYYPNEDRTKIRIDKKKSWFNSEYQEFQVEEKYYVVQWLVEKAIKENGVFSHQDFHEEVLGIREGMVKVRKKNLIDIQKQSSK